MSPAIFPPTESSPAFTGKNVLVMGLGHFGGGLGAARWLVAQGARVTVTDAAPAEKLTESLRALEGLPITFKLGGHDESDFVSADLVVINPAVDRARSPFVQAALRAGVACTSEMNLFLERCPARAVGVTGSVGKSTTTALIYEALKAGLGQRGDEPPSTRSPRQEGPRVFLGGNIGRSLLLELPSIRPQDLVVLELSSFMLEDTPQVMIGQGPRGWSPHIAVVTNIFPNHLDRHQTMAAYTAAKQNILRFQKPGDVAVLNIDHELVARWTHLARSRVIKFTTRGPGGGGLDLVMPGIHNQSNAAAALAAIGALDLPLDHAAARRAILDFPGLAHRLECVHTVEQPAPAGMPPRRLRCFNDSKATSPDAAVTAALTFDPGTAIFIVGGYDKHLEPAAFVQLDHLLATRALGVLGIGQTGQQMLERIQSTVAAPPGPRLEYVQTLANAVERATQWASELAAQAIVLSPASASWDQFPNYEDRGRQFAELCRLHLA